MGMNLIKAGYSLTVWNRTASRADELVAAGAKLAKSPQQVAAASDFSHHGQRSSRPRTNPLGTERRHAGAAARQHLRRFQHHFPALARKIAAACAERGVRFLDAPVTGGDWGAKKVS